LFSEPKKKNTSQLSRIGNRQNLKASRDTYSKTSSIPKEKNRTRGSKRARSLTQNDDRVETPTVGTKGTKKKLKTKETDEAPLFSVERFVDYDVKTRCALVKWHNYLESENSWEPLRQLNEDLETDFEAFWEGMLERLPQKKRKIAIRHRRQL
jgi:hypothetical protein